jgi:hypothetical protein
VNATLGNSAMKILKIDDKWSIEYDPMNNDRPTFWFRNGERHSELVENNAVIALFYSYLEMVNGQNE